MTENSRKCPCCKGTGKIPLAGIDKKRKYEAKAIIIQKLQGDGYTIREIVKMMGYKSTSAVAHYLKK